VLRTLADRDVRDPITWPFTECLLFGSKLYSFCFNPKSDCKISKAKVRLTA
jgi:hypothetical protein